MAVFPDIKADIEHALTYYSQNANTNEPLAVLTTGHEKCSKNKRKLGPTTYSYYILHYVHSGKGYLKYKVRNEEKTIEIIENTLFLIEPEIEYSYWPNSNDPWEYSWICFFENEDNTYSKMLKSETPIIHLNNYDTIKQEFIKILNLNEYKYAQQTKALAITFNIFAEIFENKVNPIIVKDSRNPIHSCLEYIDNNYNNPNIDNKMIASHVNLNEKYLSRLFNKFMNTSINKYINLLRIKKACFLLEKTNTSVKNISIMIGYKDQLYFSRKFKETTGKSPLEWRNS